MKACEQAFVGCCTSGPQPAALLGCWLGEAATSAQLGQLRGVNTAVHVLHVEPRHPSGPVPHGMVPVNTTHRRDLRAWHEAVSGEVGY